MSITILNDSCFNQFKLIEDGSVDLVVTDPPYKVTKYGCSGNAGGMIATKSMMNGKIFEHNNVNIGDYMPELFRVLKDGGHCYVMTNHVNLIEMLNTAKECGFHFIKSLIWNKGNKIMGGYYMSQFEYILFLRKGRGVRINNCGTSDIIEIPNKKSKGEDGKNLHDTEKPIALMELLIKNSSQEGQLVLDPFVGIGTTAIACKNLNRRFIGFELDEKYYAVAKERIDNVQGASNNES